MQTYSASTLGATPVMKDNPDEIAPQQQAAIIHQLVLPFGEEGKVEPAIHIHATAAGYRQVYQAIADSMTPDGDVAVSLAKAIQEAMPELSAQAALQSAQSYTVNRRNQALGVVNAFDSDSEMVQTAIELSARIINGDMSPAEVPQGSHSVDQVLAGKEERLMDYAAVPTGVPRENTATHAMSFAAGHVPMHQVLATMFAADSPLVDIIAGHIKDRVPTATDEMARGTAAGYLEYGEGMALVDVKHVPRIAQEAITHSVPGYTDYMISHGDRDIANVVAGDVITAQQPAARADDISAHETAQPGLVVEGQGAERTPVADGLEQSPEQTGNSR